jgi:hypothetical protein
VRQCNSLPLVKKSVMPVRAKASDTMTRFHISALVAAILIAAAPVTAKWWVLYSTLAGFFVVVGLGVAIPQLRFFGPYICRADSAKRQVALTFDDGPDPRSTPALLKVLREHGVKAAFLPSGKRSKPNPSSRTRSCVIGICSKTTLTGTAMRPTFT